MTGEGVRRPPVSSRNRPPLLQALFATFSRVEQVYLKQPGVSEDLGRDLVLISVLWFGCMLLLSVLGVRTTVP